MSIKVKETHDLMNVMAVEKVHVLYTGPFDSDILSVIAQSIENSLTENPIVNRKMFKIFVELCQNISYYSLEQEYLRSDKEQSHSMGTGIGTIAIQEFRDYFTFATGNVTNEKQIRNVIEKCKKINELNREELREFRRQQRKLDPSSRGGGNIGLIQVALTSENKIDYKIIPIGDDKLFYTVGVRINKKY